MILAIKSWMLCFFVHSSLSFLVLVAIDTWRGEGHMPVAGVVPGRNAKVGGFGLLVSLASTEDGGLRVVPGITPSFLVSGPKAEDRVNPRVWVHRTAGEAAENGSAPLSRASRLAAIGTARDGAHGRNRTCINPLRLSL